MLSYILIHLTNCCSDWDEALIVGVSSNGTYVLEYVDEGLIEEGVPASRITKAGGADAEASAAMASGAGLSDATIPKAEAAAEEEEQEDDDEEDSDDAEDILESQEEFAASRAWVGRKPGYCFKVGEQGVGYYKDVPLLEKEEAAERAKLVLTAPQLANWSVEVLSMPPSVKKVDQYMGLFDLANLRVQSMTPPAKGSSALFASLEAWFSAQLPMLAERVPSGGVEVTLRVFLAPQQSIRMGMQQVTFSVDWVRVAGSCDAEPLSSALLQRLGLSARRPQKSEPSGIEPLLHLLKRATADDSRLDPDHVIESCQCCSWSCTERSTIRSRTCGQTSTRRASATKRAPH